MCNSARGCFLLNRERIITYRDFLILFLKYYCSNKNIREQESAIKNSKLKWNTEISYEQEILKVLAKLKNIDK